MMRSEMMRVHRAMILSPLLFVLGCAVTSDDAQESTSQTDDSLSASDLPTPSPAAVVGGHACNVMGNDGPREGVHCADYAFVQKDATHFEVWGLGESLCQPSGGGTEQQCAGIRQNVNIYNITEGLQMAGAGHTCGRFGGSACPANARFQNTSGHAILTIPVGGNRAIQAALVNDEIVLPKSGKTVGPGPTVFSGIAIIF